MGGKHWVQCGPLMLLHGAGFLDRPYECPEQTTVRSLGRIDRTQSWWVASIPVHLKPVSSAPSNWSHHLILPKWGCSICWHTLSLSFSLRTNVHTSDPILSHLRRLLLLMVFSSRSSSNHFYMSISFTCLLSSHVMSCSPHHQCQYHHRHHPLYLQGLKFNLSK